MIDPDELADHTLHLRLKIHDEAVDKALALTLKINPRQPEFDLMGASMAAGLVWDILQLAGLPEHVISQQFDPKDEQKKEKFQALLMMSLLYLEYYQEHHNDQA